MAPVEFEKHIKEQMEERRISPSTSAWQKISDRLEVRKDAGRSKYWRFAAAALVAGVIASTFWMMSENDPTINGSEPVVNNPVVEPVEDSGTEDISTDPVVITATSEEESNVDEAGTQASAIEAEMPSAVAEVNNQDDAPELAEVAIEINEDSLINDKVNEVLGQVILMEETKIVVTDAEVDSLLRSAQQELMADRQFRDQYRVDASDLLAGVEEEINKSFRDQVFEKLKQGFVKVRTAVADRNK